MATYSNIPDSDINPGAIVDSSLMFRMRDNPEAVVEGNAAKKIASAAFADNSVDGDKIAVNTMAGNRLTANSVSADKLQDGTVSSSKLNLITGQVSGTVNAGGFVNVNLPQYTLNWSALITGNNDTFITGKSTGASPTSPGFGIRNNGGNTANYTIHYQQFA